MTSPLVLSYLAYLAAGLVLVVWVGRTLFANGAVFLDDVFEGNRNLALAVNRLLLAGFYLVNIGFLLLTSSLGADADSAVDRYRSLTLKLGVLALTLGVMHFVNLSALNRARRRRLAENHAQKAWGAPAAAPAPVA